MAKIKIAATILKQKGKNLYLFKINSSLLSKIAYVTPRSEEDPDELQRVVNIPRAKEIGNWLKNWFIETNNHDFIVVGDNQNRVVRYIISKIRDEIKNRPFSLKSFKSMEDFLSNLKINWRNVYKFQQIIEKFDQERLLDEERGKSGLSEEEVYEFIRQIDKQLIERNIENTGKTKLSSIHKAKGLEFDYVFLILFI